MKPVIIVGILLVLLGIVGLSYNRITYTSREKIAEIGPFQATTQKENQSRSRRYWVVWRSSPASA